MTTVAVSTAASVLGLVGLALGVVIAVLVVNMLQAVLRPLLEIDRYAKDILTAGVGIATNLDPVDELLETRRLGQALPGLAVTVLQKLGLVR